MSLKKHGRSLVWLRRDLRLEDNTALSKACAESKQVAVVFVFDLNILRRLKSRSDRRVTFIYDSVVELDLQLRKLGSRLIVVTGDPEIEVPKVAKRLNAGAVYFNEDYEPYAKKRDTSVRTLLQSASIECHQFKDHVIFSGADVTKSDGSPYKVFTPYKNAWLKKLSALDYSLKRVDGKNFVPAKSLSFVSPMPSLEEVGFERASLARALKPGRKGALKNLKNWIDDLPKYHTSRDFPSLEDGTSGLSVHLRFGTISVRECVRIVQAKPTPGARVWLSELVWRDFYQMILDQFPHVATGSFKKEYDKIKWLGSEAQFKRWCEGRTGFPIVDAGMRQLNATGWMHNRLRMITASFLVKDLLVNWRKGESYFAENLLDFDLAANNGGWQWCASTGCDAQPYFRIFNPMLQSQKFDPECEFIKKWVPELKSLSPKEIHLLASENPKAIVSHSEQKILALRMYRAAVK